MNFHKILKDEGALQEITKWLFEGDAYRGGGFKWETDVEHDWPMFWAAMPKFFPPNQLEAARKMCKDSDVVFISRTAGQLWFKFSELQMSKDNKTQFGKPGLVLMLDKDLNVGHKRG
jgi:hypothetical protein